MTTPILKRKCTRTFSFSPENGGGSTSTEIFADADGEEWYQKPSHKDCSPVWVQNKGEFKLRSSGKHCTVTDKPYKPMSTSQIIDQFIAENGGNARDALNVALARLENATALLLAAQQQSEEVMLNSLEADKEPEPEIPWEKLEGWVQWVAMDRRGAWYEYQVQPKRLSTCWGPVCGLCKASLLIQFTAVDWSTSLHKRPDPAVNDKLAGALRQILDIRFAEYPDGDESAPYKIITRMHRIAQNALK